MYVIRDKLTGQLLHFVGSSFAWGFSNEAKFVSMEEAGFTINLFRLSNVEVIKCT